MERSGGALLARIETLQKKKTMSFLLLANMARALASKFIQLLPKAKLMFSIIPGWNPWEHSARIARPSRSQSKHYCWSLTCTSSPLSSWLLQAVMFLLWKSIV